MHVGKFRVFSGITRGEVELPGTAPSIETWTGKANEIVNRSAFSTHKNVVATYFVRRAQAK